MKLPFAFLQREKEEESEYYLALLLTDEKVTAVILHESLGNLKLLRKHEEFFSATLEDNSLEGLINLVDQTISKAEEVLPPDITTHKTVFGVKDDWVEEDTKKIKKEYLAKLKKVCDALDLTPIGFMVITEAISHLIQENEGAPLSAILGDIGKKTVTLTLFRGGKIIERINGPIHESAAGTVDTLLKHFTATVLPARLILYDGKHPEALSQEFISHSWSKALPFLHVPQITTLPHGFDAKAVTFGAASQLGFAVVGMDLEIEEPKEIKETAKPEVEEQKEKEEDKKITKDDDEPSIPSDETASSHTSEMSADNFGFVMDEDITTTHPQPIIDHEEKSHNDKDEEQPFVSDNFTPSDEFHEEETGEDEMQEEKTTRNPFSMLSALKLPQFSMSGLGGRRKLLVPLIAVALFIISLGIFTFYYFNSVQAKIILSVKPKIVTQDETVVFSDSAESNFSKNIIAAKPLETTVEGSVSTSTTGKKDVGEKAKGTVTIYNNADKSVSLDSGTAMKASNGTTFVLDKSVSIASASGDIFSGTKPGTADVGVTAKEIGTEGNLPSGTKFTIGSTSTLAAKNDSAFSGGSKKQVQVVSKNDVAKLRTDLPKSLEEKAKETIKQTVADDETLLPSITVVKVAKENFDNDIDEEAKTVKLTASITFSSLAYKKAELNKYTISLFKEKYSQEISEDTIKTNIGEPEENDKEQIEAKLTMEAGLLPDIDTADIAKKVEPMSRKDALSFLSGLPQVADTKIDFAPGIPFIFNLFPRLPNQISVEVQPE